MPRHPARKPFRRRPPRTISPDPELWARLVARAKAANRKIVAELELALRAYLDAEGKTP